jgi:hypothetical protein
LEHVISIVTFEVIFTNIILYEFDVKVFDIHDDIGNIDDGL